MKKMKGVITPIITPFTKSDQIDLEMLHRLVGYLAAKGVHSVYPNGTTGEMLKMSLEERKVVASEVVAAAKGAIDVFIQVGAPTTKEAIELAKHAYEAGADGIGVVTPQFFGVNEREMVQYYADVASAVPQDYPVYLYSIPQCAANDILPHVVDLILEKAKNVVGIKYSGSNVMQMKDYLKCNNGDFDVVVGPDRLFLAGLTMGCVGTVSGCSQCGPDAFVQTYEAFVQGDLQAAMEAQKRATELAEIVKAGANMAYFKAALAFHGIGSSYMRAPALDLTAEEKKPFLEELGAFDKRYGYTH